MVSTHTHTLITPGSRPSLHTGTQAMCGSGSNGTIILQGALVSTQAASGRVEVCVGSVWRTVCAEEWDEVDARVACRQLFEGAVTQGTSELVKETAQSCVSILWYSSLRQ